MEEHKIYRVYSEYLKEKYKEKVYKLPVNLPVTCPNRTDGMGGCIFCAEQGTGFEAISSAIGVKKQLEMTKEHIRKKYKANLYIAYFQNYTNTYLPPDKFREYMLAACEDEQIAELSVSTRPDCIHKIYLDILKEIQEEYNKEITIELGLQTVNYHTLTKINRGHGLGEFLDSVLQISQYGFQICVHIILNLPYDTMEDVTETARVLSALPIHMVKIHSLYVPKNTQLYKLVENGTISLGSKEEYLERLTVFVEQLRPDIVIERLFSRIPEKDSAFSNWGTSWWKLKDEWLLSMEEKGSYQGIHYDYLHGAALRKGGFISGES